jgi:membrane protein
MPSKRIARLVKIISGAAANAEDEIFLLEGRLERFVHFWVLVIRQFVRHRCLVRASALSYATLLALIPLLVVAFSVTSTLLKDTDVEKLNQFVEKTVASLAPPANIPTNSISLNTNAVALTSTNAVTENDSTGSESATNPAAIADSGPSPTMTANTQKEVARWIHDLIQKTSSAARTVGVTGIIFLVFTAISLLRGIEETFNDIWGVTRGRNWLLQIMLYWTILTLGPLLLVSALGVTGSLHLQQTRSFVEQSPFLAPLYAHGLPIALISLMLALFYKLTPNTKVEFSAALVGGLFAGAAWHFYNQLSFLLAAKVLSASTFYGSLALIVLLMGGLYIVWVILLFGAQIAYAYQNRAAYLQDRLAENVNQRGREFVALRIMTCLGQRFRDAERPATVPQISAELGIPSRLTQSVLRTLAHMQLVTETAGGEAAFVPARPLETINAYDILLAMRTGGGQELPLSENPALTEIYGEFARIEQAERKTASAITLLALANRVPARAEIAAPKTVETEKQLQAAAPVVELPKTELEKEIPFVEKNSDLVEGKNAVETKALEPAPVSAARREVVRPEENRDFPL